jgi:hypothetical protein
MASVKQASCCWQFMLWMYKMNQRVSIHKKIQENNSFGYINRLWGPRGTGRFAHKADNPILIFESIA